MSTQTSSVASRSAPSTLMQRLLQKLGLFNKRSAVRSPAIRRRPAFAFETLEPRLLLSADLTGSLAGLTVPDHILPSDHLTIPVVVHNGGVDASDLTPVVRLYASATGHIDSDSVVLGESAIKNAKIKAGQSATVNVAIDPSAIGAPGSYSLIAVVDATNKVRESNEANNTTVAAQPLHIDWSFGTVAGHTNSNSLTLTDHNGTQVTFQLSGPGHGDVTLDANGFDVHLTGTTTSSKLSVTATGGSHVATLNDLQVDGSLGALQASGASLTGNFNAAGVIRSIDLGDIGQEASIALSGTGGAIKFSADRVTGADIFSASPFDSFRIEEWRAAGNDAGSIVAPSIGDLEVDGNFAGTLKLSGAGTGSTLGSAEIAGRVSSTMWNIVGATGSVEAGSTAAAWHGNFDSIQQFTTDGDMRGVLAAPVVGTIHVGGDMVGARVLVGADLGSDGLAGGTGSAADHFSQAVLAQLRVDHSIRDSSILVGVNPVDGVYGNGNDVIMGGQASRIQSLIVDGRLLGTTDITAGAFASKVKINGAYVNPASVPQLHTSLLDSVPPQLSAALAFDTGASASDGITASPTIAGTVSDAGGIATFRASLDGSAAKDVRALVQPDGSFSFDAATLGTILGSPLADGSHTLVLLAADATTNASTLSLSFTLDRSAPAIAAFGLDAGSDTGIAGDQLTAAVTVTLNGVAEAGATVQLLGTGMSTIADATGIFSFAGVALNNEGANTFTVRATDLAGNAATTERTIVRDTTAPLLSAGLQNDTGVSNSDGWTADPTLTGHVNDASNVVSLTVSFDGNSSETLAVPAPDFGFTLTAGYLDSVAGGSLADGPHSMFVHARDAAGNVSVTEVDFILDRSVPTTPMFDLDPASDSGAQGDQHTTSAVVTLTGLADTGGTLTIDGRSNVAVFEGNVFHFNDVALNPGANVLTVSSTDLAGNKSSFTQTIFLDGAGPGTGEGPFPDLVVTSIGSHLTGGVDDFGQALLQVDWTTANTGSATAHGRVGAWSDSVYLSMFDATPFSGDDIWLGSVLNSDLAAGDQRLNTITVSVPNWAPQSGYHIYVVTDDEVNFTANEVAEKTAGEYNNTTIEYVPSGIAPPPIAPSGPVLALDGTATAGSIDAGGSNVYTFSIDHESRLYFDSLSANSGLQWELQDAGGHTLSGHTFNTSDAFGTDGIGALMDLQSGEYHLVVEGTTATGEGDYAFRLLDVNAVASHQLILDGGPLLGQHMDRGDRTDVYQFFATEGTHYVVGGLNDNTFEDQMVFRLFDQHGHQVWTGDNSPSDIETFSETGTYTLLVEGNVEHTDPLNYNVYVFTPQDRHVTVPFVGQVHGFLDSPDQVNTYTFTLTEESHLFFDGHLNSNGPYFNWTLAGEGGSTRFDSPGFMDLGAGTYTLTIQAQDHASGWYDFTLMDLLHDPAPLLPVNVPMGGIVYPGFTSTLYHFDAHAGEHLSIAYNDEFGPDPVSFDPATWLLVDSGGQVAASGTVGDPAGVDFDADGHWALLIKGRQGNWSFYDYSVELGDGQVPPPPGVTFDLAPESDTGVIGDHHTTLPFVNLAGTATPGSFLTLAGTPLTAVADAAGAFQFVDVALVQGDNTFTVFANDSLGNFTQFSRTIFLDAGTGGGTGAGEPLPDLVVTNIDYTAGTQDEAGNTPLHVEWTVANTGAIAANSASGTWTETLYASRFDARPFGPDDIWLGSWSVDAGLAAGAQQVSVHDLVLPSFIEAGYHLYVLVDDGNQVFEKTAGEYNNTTVDYVPSGIAPPPIANSAPELLLDGTAVAGSIDTPGEVDVFTFTLDHESNLLFDSLSAHSDVKWELQDASGNVLFGRTFDQSDAFGMGPINAMLHLQSGSYKIAVSDTFAFGTDDYAFRLLDVNAVASHQLVLDGGPLLGQHMDRGDQMDVYQFQAAVGQQYVVGGPSDTSFEHAAIYRLFDPEGNQVWSGSTSPSDLHTFQETGTYTLVVDGNVEHTDPADYNVYVFTPQDRHFDLPFTGSQVSGFLDAPGQVNTYAFSLVGSSTFAVDGVLGSNGTVFDWTIDGPNGEHFSGNTSFDSPLMNLDQGNYTISIKGEGDASGWYNFRLMDVLRDSAQVLTPDVAVNNISFPGFDSNLFRIEVMAGQHFVVSLTTADAPDMAFDPPQWSLLDPQGHVFETGVVGVPAEFNPDQNGGWTLLLSGRQFSWTPVDFTLGVFTQMAS